jgi:5,5'-dehydrodivanillate O-demethylase
VTETIQRFNQAATQPAWADFQHTGPGTVAGQFMRRFWHPVRRSRDLPRGRAIPMQIMNERFTMYRGQDDAAHALAFRCAHRGTQLSTGWVEGDFLRCRYHGWMYDGSGQCVDQPAEPEPFAQGVRIRAYPVQEYLGLIFVYMGEGDPPPLPRYPWFDSSDGVIEAVLPKRSESNYFRRVEQISDEAHLMFAHRFEKPYSKFDVPRMEAEETEYGIFQYGHRASGKTRMTHYLIPNLMYVTNNALLPEESGPRQRIMWKVPIDDDHYWNLGVLLLHLSEEAAVRYREQQAERDAAQRQADTPRQLARILDGDLTLEEVEDRADISHLEDEVVLAGMGLASEGPLTERLGRTDIGVVLKRTIWERELRALAEGRPLKQWTVPEALEVAEGI